MHTDKPLRIIFLGTPAFAAYHLEQLVAKGFCVVAVITNVDKPTGRGLRPTPSAVKIMAQQLNIPILQPPKLNNRVFVEQVRAYRADIQVVVAFRVLPEVLWAMPRLGTVNMHASYLPNYRGAAPIHWAIINGETSTGVSTFQLQRDIDTGGVFRREKIPIAPDETAGTLHDKLQIAGAKILIQTLTDIQNGTTKAIAQNQLAPEWSTIRLAPKIRSADCEINFCLSASEVALQIRGLSPCPGAYTFIDGKMLKIYGAQAQESSERYTCGQILSDDRTFLAFGCKQGLVLATDVQLAGKRRMTVKDFLNGYRIQSVHTQISSGVHSSKWR